MPIVERDIVDVPHKFNSSYVGIIAGPATALGIMEYVMALDTLVGLEYRIERL